jgi:hypothetical protein
VVHGDPVQKLVLVNLASDGDGVIALNPNERLVDEMNDL